MPDKQKVREYQTKYREEHREQVNKRAREWWRKKHGSVPRAEYLSAIKAATAAKKAEKEKERKERKRERKMKIAPVSPPAPRPAPAPRPVANVRKPGRLLAMAGFVRNW